MSIYKNYAKYYDLLYTDKNYVKEAKYVNDIISKHSKKHKNILELGCGTGIHAIELAKSGYWIDGIDLSKGMLQKATKRIDNLPKTLASKLSFSLGDIRNFRNKKKYDIVISLFHVTSYMTTNHHVEEMFKTANIHLKKDGLFIFDCWYGPTVLTDRPVERIKNLENKEIKVIRIAKPEIFPNENMVNVNYEISIIDKVTKKSEKTNETHTVRYFFKPEIVSFLEKAGFKLIDARELITNKKPGFDTWGVCFIAKKVN
jgi:SAM-dependent methyltransferase